MAGDDGLSVRNDSEGDESRGCTKKRWRKREMMVDMVNEEEGMVEKGKDGGKGR